MGTPRWIWLSAALGVLASITVLAVAKRLARQERDHDPEEGPFTRKALLALARSTSLLLLVGVSLGAVSLLATLPDKWGRIFPMTAILSLAVQGALWIQSLINVVLDRSEARAQTLNPGSTTAIRTLGLIAKSTLWILMVLLALHNAGVNITALVAGLGIGGVAVALALQNILADGFASLAIVLDKPYQVGDFIAVGDSMGTVVRIGIKTTRLASQSGEQLVFSNSELLKNRIRNFRRLSERRVEFMVGVAFQTPFAKAEQIPSILREIISADPRVRLERVHFKEIGDACLTFECVYDVMNPSHRVYLDVQEAINLAILRRFQESGIELAHPNRTLYLAPGVAPVRW